MPVVPNGEKGRCPAIWMRADGGAQAGFGHWVRVRRLGARISSWASVYYVVQDHQYDHRFFDTCSEAPSVLGQHHALKVLQFVRPDCLITDLVQIDGETRGLIDVCRQAGAAIVSIHDLGLGIYDSDMAIDPSVAAVHSFCPEQYVHGFYGGPQYAVLPGAFRRLREMPGSYPPQGRSLLVSLGGGCVRKVLEPLLPALGRLAKQLKVTVLAGLAAGTQQWLKECCPPEVECCSLAANDDPAKLLFEADIALVAGGVTLYEAACLGTPALVVSHHELQQITASRFEALGIAQNLGPTASLEAAHLEAAVLALAGDADRRAAMGIRGRVLVDGRGAERVERLISGLCRAGRN